jgi:hypothetical protein
MLAQPSPGLRRPLATLSRMREREGAHRASDGKGEGDQQAMSSRGQVREHANVVQAVEPGDRLA